MIRKLLQAVLCLVLCPLLLAQPATTGGQQQPFPQPDQPATTTAPAQPVTITIPKDTRVEFLLLDPVSSASSKPGDKIRFVVAENLIVNGVVAISAGTPAPGVVTKVTKAIPGKRDGRIEIRPTVVRIGRHRKIHFTDSPAASTLDPAERRHERKFLMQEIITAPFWIVPVTFGVWIPDSRAPQPGARDKKRKSCFEFGWFTTSASTIRVASLASPTASPVAEAAPCGPG